MDYYRDEPKNSPFILEGNNRPTNVLNCDADPITNFESFEYKSSIIVKTPNNDSDSNNVIENVEIIVRLKYLSNFWRALHMSLINCEVSLTLTWSKNCILTDVITRTPVSAQGDNPERPVINASIGATFKIKDAKMYLPVVTLSAENDNKLLVQLKSGFKITIKWKKYRSEMSNQARNNNLNYLIDPAFTNVNRLFVLSFKNEYGNYNENENIRTSFSKYYVPKIEVKGFNVLIDGKPFFEVPVTNSL